MITPAKFDEIKTSSKLPSPKGIALRVIDLTQQDDVTSQEIANVIKSDPALSGLVIKVANLKQLAGYSKICKSTLRLSLRISKATYSGYNSFSPSGLVLNRLCNQKY